MTAEMFGATLLPGFLQETTTAFTSGREIRARWAKILTTSSKKMKTINPTWLNLLTATTMSDNATLRRQT
jgi:hypothetical protein